MNLCNGSLLQINDICLKYFYEIDTAYADFIFVCKQFCFVCTNQ
jgi:hypothetical protein